MIGNFFFSTLSQIIATNQNRENFMVFPGSQITQVFLKIQPTCRGFPQVYQPIMEQIEMIQLERTVFLIDQS